MRVYCFLFTRYPWDTEMINVQTGQISFDGGVTISPLTVIDDLCDSVDLEGDKMLENGCWKTFLVRGRSLAGRPVSFLALFENGGIRSLHVSCVSGFDSWAEHSTANESEVKAANDKLLEELLGREPPYRFPWGTAESVFDSKTGDAVIVIRYGEF